MKSGKPAKRAVETDSSSERSERSPLREGILSEGTRSLEAGNKAGDEVGNKIGGGVVSGGDFQAIGSIVRGATHIRNDRPCQDALFLRVEKDFAIACVADGHGSASCPYSDEGASAAVKIAAEVLAEMLPNLPDHKDILLPRRIESEWKKEVERLHAESGRDAPESEPFPYILYGTPLLAVAENVGEDTESLCLDDAWTFVRTQIIPRSGREFPALFLLATDGYANSFADSSGFLKVGTDFFNIWQEESLDVIAENLENWLRKSSDKGSGDDIAMGVLTWQ